MLNDHEGTIFELFAVAASLRWFVASPQSTFLFSSRGTLFGETCDFDLTKDFLRVHRLDPPLQNDPQHYLLLCKDADEEISFELQKLFKKVNTDHINKFFEGKNV
jgi:hypothetical protein